jgi:type VI secretion system secreted protein VgrG
VVLPIEYQAEQVTSGEHRVMSLHRTWPREYVLQTVMNVGLNTDMITYAHEFGHLVGKPDEYSYLEGRRQQVRYYRPDGTLAPPLVVTVTTRPTTPDHSIMGDGYRALERHAWSVAIEAQELLTQKLGRKVRCSIDMAVKDVGF